MCETLPKGTNILQKRTVREMGEGGCANEIWELNVGIPWSPSKFLEQATEAKHPLQAPAVIPDDVKKSCGAITRSWPQGLG